MEAPRRAAEDTLTVRVDAMAMEQSRILKTFLSRRVFILRGDITEQGVDAIVNAAIPTNEPRQLCPERSSPF